MYKGELRGFPKEAGKHVTNSMENAVVSYDES